MPRGLDVFGNNMVVGLTNGTIIQFDLESSDFKVLMESHFDGEVQGMDVDEEFVYTSGVDN